MATARAARRDRAQARKDRDAGTEHGVVRGAHRQRDHAAHEGDRGDAHQLPDRVHRARARARRAGQAKGHPGLCGRRACLRAFPVYARRPGRRLLRDELAQVAARAHWHRLLVREKESDQVALAVDGRRHRTGERHPQVRGDRNPPGCQPQRDLCSNRLQSRHWR